MTTDRTDTDQRKRSSAAPALIAAAVLLLPVGYVLSVGPAAWLIHNRYLDDSTVILYLPLRWLHDQCKPIGDALEWYMKLWGVP